MRLQLRLLVVMVMALLAVAGILVVQHQIDLGRLDSVIKSETSQRKTYFGAILSIDQQPLETLARDYSFWDQMVDFVHTRDQGFATDNIDTSLSTFNVDVAWVYGLDNKLIYASQADDEHPVDALTLPKALTDSLRNKKFDHFYYDDNGSLLEIRAATIVPSDDPDHTEAASGYWIVARKIDDKYIKQLASLSQSSDTIVQPAQENDTTLTKTQVGFTTDLKDWSGKTIRVLKTAYEVPIVSDLNHSYMQQLILVGIFGVLLIIVVTGVLWVWVLRPIRKIIGSITSHRPKLLDQLAHSHSELGRLARTVQQFFEQKEKIAEDAIRRADLENLNKEKTVFLSVAAHELKGPISIVHMITGDLPLEAIKLTRAQLNEQLETVARQTSKMALIINDLHSASQGDLNNKLEYQPTNVDFDEFMRQEIAANQLITKQNIHFSGGTGKLVFADAARLSQVVSNLIRNASKYAPDSKTIDISTHANSTTISFKVSDHGIGIARAEQKKIFRQFYRATNAVAHFQGLGIGLSVCEQIVKEFGGTITVESELQKGSTFTVELKAIK